MPQDRRQFMVSLASATLGILPSRSNSFGEGARVPQQAARDKTAPQDGIALSQERAPSRRLDVALFFDVEDVFSPPEVGNDDSIKELATILTEEGLRGNFLFIGDRALHLGSRGRRDVVESLAPHDVGLHTRSARHPTNPEYVAGQSWEDGVARSLDHERQGAQNIQEVFGKPCAALSGHNVFDSPHAQRAAGILGLPFVYCYPAAPPLYSLSWYAGALGLPYTSPTLNGQPFRAYFEFEDDNYPDDEKFQGKLQLLDEHIDLCSKESQPFLTLFLYHPQRVNLIDFIDTFWSPNGVNYPGERWGMYGRPRRRTTEQVRTALANFRQLARRLRHDPRLNIMTVSEVARKYGRQPDSIPREELLAAAKAISATEDILIHPRFSPAEMVCGLARAVTHFGEAGQLPDAVPRPEVLGPTRSPIWHPELQVCSFQKLTDLARRLLDSVATSGHLPATLGAPLERVGVNHLYGALAESLRGIDSGPPPAEIRFRRMMPWPALAPSIGIRYLKAVEGEMMDPDTEVNTLYRDGKLQTWTLKPALFS